MSCSVLQRVAVNFSGMLCVAVVLREATLKKDSRGLQ